MYAGLRAPPQSITDDPCPPPPPTPNHKIVIPLTIVMTSRLVQYENLAINRCTSFSY